MLRAILDDVSIYQHLCRKIIKHAENLNPEHSNHNRENYNRLVNDSRRAVHIRKELIEAIGKIKLPKNGICGNCAKELKTLNAFELIQGKKTFLCTICHSHATNVYRGTLIK